jgi:uncharacterized protein YdaU (DUF1376 family)
MAIQKPEWFKMDPAKFLCDAQVDAMSTLELGACFRLLCRQWIDGSIPDDLRLLARLCRLDDSSMAEAWITLAKFFPVIEPGKRANRFMWVEREKVVADLEKRSDEGTRLARKRWDETKRKRNAEANASLIASPNASGMPEPMQDQTRPDQTRADANDAPGMPHPLPEQRGDTSGIRSRQEVNLNSIEVSQHICAENAWSGQKMIWALREAIEFQAKRVPETSLEQTGEWLVKAYRDHQTSQGKFAVGPQKFFEEGRYQSSSPPSGSDDYFKKGIFTDNPATRALAQMEAE